MRIRPCSPRTLSLQFLLWLACGAVSIPPLLWPLIASGGDLPGALLALLILAAALTACTSCFPLLYGAGSIFQRAFRAGIIIRLIITILYLFDKSGPPFLYRYIDALDSHTPGLLEFNKNAVAAAGLCAYTGAIILLCALLLAAWRGVIRGSRQANIRFTDLSR